MVAGSLSMQEREEAIAILNCCTATAVQHGIYSVSIVGHVG